jgi:hypothetical protein
MLGFANINLYGSSDYSQVEFNVHRPALKDKGTGADLRPRPPEADRCGLPGLRQSGH